MSLFRSPVEESSSDEDCSSDKGELIDEAGQYSSRDGDATTSRNQSKARKSSFNDALAGSFEEVLDNKDPEQEVAGFDAEGHATMMTTALLEYYCLTKATEILNEQKGSRGRYTRESPEARLLGRRLYAHKSRFLSANGVVAAGVDGDDWETTRKYYRDSLDLLGLSALEGLSLDEKGSRPSSRGAKSESRVVLSRRTTERPPQDCEQLGINELPAGTETRPALQRLLTNGPEVGLPDHIPSPLNFMRTPSVQTVNYFPMGNLPGIYQPYRPSPLVSRYATEFEEESLIGKGSYGAVYKAKHFVDGQFYAIKKIPLSSKRLKQLQDRGLQELDHILKEIRTLARLDHSNVVRYFGAWAEYNATMQAPLSTVPQPNRPLGLLSQGSVAEDESNHGVVFEESSNGIDSKGSDHGIVFESSFRDKSLSGEMASLSRGQGFPREASNTDNSRNSRKSFVESYDGEGDDQEHNDEAESIGRRFSCSVPGETMTSLSELNGDIFTDGAGNDSIQVSKTVASGTQSPITLHIQMSLHPLSLAKYLRPRSEESDGDSPCHCYHLVPSIKILLGILSGVEYLHSQGIIHRDLKPANVFLSLPQKHNRTICSPCERDGNFSTHYAIPRIGDFGLVADTSPCTDGDGEATSVPTNNRPVGTEFYRPPVCQCRNISRERNRKRLHANLRENIDNVLCDCSSNLSSKPQIDESLDIYALGVILFELVYKFGTRMERQMVLSDLTCSQNVFRRAKRTPSTHESQMKRDGLKPMLPDDFEKKIDCAGIQVGDEDNTASIAEKLAGCIIKMVEPDSRRRWTCSDVRTCLEDVLSLAEHAHSSLQSDR
ncbi:serine/threonine protein kinase [Emydomyces testavorans]|uniref:Serine/threonine protein kinase n=1 Tax=Emydomyces testavorans TaxID=2070801 RepID=A0AAF0IL16_9EURO|nr:serine/threonine protein kinase [Emydomyces testavorans]